MIVRRNRSRPAKNIAARAPVATPTKAERVQKMLAQAGFGSRREIESWIVDGRVAINSVTAKLGDSIRSGDKVSVDGRVVSMTRLAAVQTRVLGYYKPPGVMCTRRDPEGRPTIYELLPKRFRGRWVSVGRLDFNTSGLLLLTNDGELANRLMHPSAQIEREYAVRVLGKVAESAIARICAGVELEDGTAAFGSVVAAGGAGANQWFKVTLKEGRNREVRRLWESQQLVVSRLIRTRYGNVELTRDHRQGDWWELDDEAKSVLCASVNLSARNQSTVATGSHSRGPKLSRGRRRFHPTPE